MADFEKVYSVKIDTRDAVSGFQKLETLARSLDAKLKRLNKTSNITAKRFEKLGLHIKESVIGTKSLNANLSRMNRKLRDTTNRSKDMNRAMVKGFSQTEKQVTRLNRKMKKSGFLSGGSSTTFKIAGAAAVGFTTNAIRSNIKLNESMANVQTLLSGGADQVNRLKGEIQSLAIETGKPTADLAEGLYEVVSALGESSDNMNQLKVATKAAIAGKSSTLGAVKLLSAVTKGYGDTSSKAQEKVSDLAFQTVKLGQTTFPELASSIGKVVPVAAAMNTTQEELFASMATLTGVTGDTAEVSTQLASVYSAFLKPRKAMTQLAKQEGFETAAQMLKNKGLAKTLDILKEKTGGNIDEIAQLVVRKEAQLALVALLGKQYDTYNDKLGQMGKAAGSTSEAFKKQTEGINAQGQAWKRASQTITVFSQQLGDSLAPALQGVLDILIPMVGAISGLTAGKKLDEQEGISEESFAAKGIARRGTPKQKKEALAKAMGRRAKLERSAKIGEDVGMFESAAYLISGGESPMAKRQRIFQENERAISQLQAGVAGDKNWASLSGGMTAYGAALSGAAGGATTNNNNNVTINVQGTGNPEATAQAVKRQLARELSGKTKTTGNGG